MSEEEGKKKKQPAGAPLWMCTFADLMSLLLCFFVLLLSFSVMDNQTYKVVAGSMREAFGLQRKMPTWDSPRGQEMISRDFESIPFTVEMEIIEEVDREIEAGLVEVAKADDGVITMRVKDSLMFDLGKAELKPAFTALLDRIGPIFVKADAELSVQGHTDNLPIRGESLYKTNWALSAARAVSVAEYLVEKFAIPHQHIFAAGYADGRPVSPNDTEAGRSRNRRVEFAIHPKKGDMVFEGIGILNKQSNE